MAAGRLTPPPHATRNAKENTSANGRIVSRDDRLARGLIEPGDCTPGRRVVAAA